jgi:hypothetical protein
MGFNILFPECVDVKVSGIANFTEGEEVVGMKGTLVEVTVDYCRVEVTKVPCTDEGEVWTEFERCNMDSSLELGEYGDTFVRRDTFTVDDATDGVSVMPHLGLDRDETFTVILSNKGVIIRGHLHPGYFIVTNVVDTRLVTKKFVEPMTIRRRIRRNHTM